MSNHFRSTAATDDRNRSGDKRISETLAFAPISQITKINMPIIYRLGALPTAQPTVSKVK